MRKLREIARLFLELKLGVRPIARACNISPSTAHTYMERLRELGAGYGATYDVLRMTVEGGNMDSS